LPRAPRTIVDLLVRASRSDDTGLRLLDRSGAETWMPWAAVFDRACAARERLLDLGIRHGDRVGLVFATEPAFFDALFGVMLAGGVPVPLYPPVRLGRLDEYRARTSQMLRAVGARLLLANRRAYHVLGEVARDAGPALGCRVLDVAPGLKARGPTNGVLTWDPGSSDRGRIADISPSDIGLIQFSSGTVDEPKAAALTHDALVAQAALLNGYWPDTPEIRHSGVSWLPLYHDMGLIGCVFTAVERPGTLTLIPPEAFVARPAIWLQTISRYRASVSPAPNFAYSLAAQRIRDEEMEGLDLSCWRVALCGAETVVPDVMRAFQSRFARWGLAPETLTPVYGLSEAALAVTFSDITRPFVSRRFDRQSLARDGVAVEADGGRELVSVGRPLPGFEVRVVTDEGKPLPESRLGLVECRGPSIMERYENNPQATRNAFHDGWLRTGDLGFLWKGDLFLAGRRKDVLIVRGANHSPEEVEGAVQGVDGVRAGCAVAVSWLPEDADGEQVLLFVEARRGVARGAYEQIAAACPRRVIAATGLVADQVIVLAPGTLPRTSSGKLRRQETLRRHLAGTLGPAPAPTAARMARAVARSAFAHLQAKLRTG
jgi:acyl-CoA synthetase (AMP-forming)/AMP-acid ligase II